MKEEPPPIRTQPRPKCHVCGATGRLRYKGLKDRLFGVQGVWALKECPDCGLMWLDPMPVEKDLGRLYETYYTHSPSSRHGGLRSLAKNAYWNRRWTTRKLGALDRALGMAIAAQPLLAAQADNMVFRLPVVENGRLLEVGCGNGETLKRLSELGWDTHGIDFDPKAIASARELGLKVEVGDLQSQQYPSDYFDAVVMSHVLEHVPNPRALLREVWRILAPAGTLVSITPNSGSIFHARFQEDWIGLDPPRHLHIFDVRSAQTLLDEQKWSCSVQSTFANSHGIIWSSSQLRKFGAYDMTSRPDTLMAIRCRLLQAWTAAFASDRQGDELVLTATKTRDPVTHASLGSE